MSDIRPEHWTRFMKLCDEVEAAGVELDRPNIRQMLFEGIGKRFPGGQSAVCAALKGPLSVRANAARLQLWAMACGSPQERTGFDSPSFAIKIVDQTRGMAPGDDLRFPVAVDVLRSGRRVLEIYGLRLDSENDTNCCYRPRGSLLSDLGNTIVAIPEYDPLIRTLIQNFPGDGMRLKKAKQAVLEELAESAAN